MSLCRVVQTHCSRAIAGNGGERGTQAQCAPESLLEGGATHDVDVIDGAWMLLGSRFCRYVESRRKYGSEDGVPLIPSTLGHIPLCSLVISMCSVIWSSSYAFCLRRNRHWRQRNCGLRVCGMWENHAPKSVLLREPGSDVDITTTPSSKADGKADSAGVTNPRAKEENVIIGKAKKTSKTIADKLRENLDEVTVAVPLKKRKHKSSLTTEKRVEETLRQKKRENKRPFVLKVATSQTKVTVWSEEEMEDIDNRLHIPGDDSDLKILPVKHGGDVQAPSEGDENMKLREKLLAEKMLLTAGEESGGLPARSAEEQAEADRKLVVELLRTGQSAFSQLFVDFKMLMAKLVVEEESRKPSEERIRELSAELEASREWEKITRDQVTTQARRLQKSEEDVAYYKRRYYEAMEREKSRRPNFEALNEPAVLISCIARDASRTHQTQNALNHHLVVTLSLLLHMGDQVAHLGRDPIDRDEERREESG
ncbi:hypothetical protein KSP40_PGU002389 [Platanthera guangdongensis]|uniref:Uncharacterized protein n=1 Tax=Platanthera guangdongensis TaxID=2320717 RepID=A0ABR2MEH0_9ASPA